MPIVHTEHLDLARLTDSERHQIYCGFDNCITAECLPEEYKLMHSNSNPRPQAQHIYNFERAIQAPYLEMMLRGFAVNLLSRQDAINHLRQRIERLQHQLMMLTNAISDFPFDERLPRSSTSQLPKLFYEVLRLPQIWTSKKGVRKLSMDRNALEKLHETYLYARPFVSHILAIRDLSKQLEVLQTDIDADGRFRSSYNIAGTETGRPSSSENAFGTGGNAQNIAPGLRYIFTADPGYKLCVIDFEQSEARDLGFVYGCLFNDWSYLDSCESGDVHTNNAKLVWPELPWTGDPAEDRQIANRTFYRDFTYRDMAKRGSHLSNYMGTPWTMARHLKITQAVAEEFQHRYCRGPDAAFPVIARYWQWVSQQIQQTYRLITPLGRERHFFGNTQDDATLREAICYVPQSTTSDRTNLGLWKVWKDLPHVQLLAQGYDSITFQALDDSRFDDTVQHVRHLLDLRLEDPTSGRGFTVPNEAKVGYNWGSQSKTNPTGLAKWKPSHNGLR